MISEVILQLIVCPENQIISKNALLVYVYSELTASSVAQCYPILETLSVNLINVYRHYITQDFLCKQLFDRHLCIDNLSAVYVRRQKRNAKVRLVFDCRAEILFLSVRVLKAI